jgi:hypothetical protein
MKFIPFLGIKKKTFNFFAYFVQNLVLIVLIFIPFILFLTNFNTLLLLFLVCIEGFNLEPRFLTGLILSMKKLRSKREIKSG